MVPLSRRGWRSLQGNCSAGRVISPVRLSQPTEASRLDLPMARSRREPLRKAARDPRTGLTPTPLPLWPVEPTSVGLRDSPDRIILPPPRQAEATDRPDRRIKLRGSHVPPTRSRRDEGSEGHPQPQPPAIPFEMRQSQPRLRSGPATPFSEMAGKLRVPLEQGLPAGGLNDWNDALRAEAGRGACDDPDR